MWETLGLRFPSTPVCPGHSTPFAALCDAFFARHPVSVWKASRAMGGKTNLMGALAFAEAVTLRASVTILGGSGEQSERVHEYLRNFWRQPRAPVAALLDDPSSKRTRLIWGNTVQALMASRRSVSGLHPQRLRIDEADLVDLKILDQSFGQPMTKNGVDAQIVVSSAHYEPDGTLTEMLKRADANPATWSSHTWCWKECVAPQGWLAKREVDRTRSMVTAEMWRVQYDGQEPSPEGRAIDPAKVERMFQGPEIEVGMDDVPYREYEPPIEGASYATGADWARHRDYVEIVTLRDDVSPIRLVAYQRFRKRPTPYILQAFERQTTRYPGEAAHDATGGGNYIDDFLADPVEAVVMVGMTRKDLFTNYFVAIEHEMIVAPRIAPLYRQHKFVRNDDIWRPGGHPPDGVVACAMAYKASNRKPLMLLTSRPSVPVEIYAESGANGLPALPVDADPSTPAGRMFGFLRERE